MKALDWLGRLLLLVLSGLATLSLVTALVSVSNTPSGVVRPGEVPVATVGTATAPHGNAPPQPQASVAADGRPALAAAIAPFAAEKAIARWLEALAYGVLALAGFAAAALLVLLRITYLLARIAGR